MPTRASKPCSHGGCSALTIDRYCITHQPLHPAWGKRWAGSTTDRGYGWAWVKTRRRILQRDSYLCQVCRIRQANEVDHRRNKASGGTDDDSNLQAICHGCHTEKTKLEAVKGKKQ